MLRASPTSVSNFTYQAEKLGYHSQIILAGRKVNDSMGAFVADAAIKELIKAGKAPKKAKVAVFGLTFKENCPDIRNSKVEDIIKRLNEYDINPIVVDPWADKDESKKVYGVDITDIKDLKDLDCIILAVAHKEFKALSIEELNKLYSNCADNEKILVDVKGIYNKEDVSKFGFSYWRL